MCIIDVSDLSAHSYDCICDITTIYNNSSDSTDLGASAHSLVRTRVVMREWLLLLFERSKRKIPLLHVHPPSINPIINFARNSDTGPRQRRPSVADTLLLHNTRVLPCRLWEVGA